MRVLPGRWSAASALISALLMLATGRAGAATSTTWETAGYQDFLKGTIAGLTVSADGLVQPGPAPVWETPLGQPALWSLAMAPNGETFAATGNSGKVYRIAPDGKPSLLWSSPQPEVFAVAVDSQGALWAASSPNGALYQLMAQGSGAQAREVWRSPERYIWSLAAAPDGSLFVGTGDKGRVYKVEASGKSSLYYESGQSNITALAIGKNGHLLAGSDPNGLLYDIAEAGKATVLYDSALPEIRAIAVAPDGTVYATALGGAVSSRGGSTASASTSTSSAVVTAATPTVITVTEATQLQSGAKLPDATTKAAAGTATASANAGAGTTITETAGVDRSALYRIAPDRTVETLRTSREDNMFDLVLTTEGVLFSTDDHGRVYDWQAGKMRLIAELGQGEATRILRSSAGYLVGTSNPARVVRLSMEAAAQNSVGRNPSLTSQVHDAGSVARWGHVWARPAVAGLLFETRTGNSQRADATWSDWKAAGDGGITSPLGRYVQWRVQWPSASKAAIQEVGLSYLPQNTPPVIRSVSATSVLGANAAKNAATAASSSAAYSVTVTDTGEAPSSTTTVGPNQTVSRLQATQTQISWQADDPDGDRLVYALYFRAEDAHEWQLIRSRMFENTLLLDPDVFADGRYVFRVVASDAPANAAAYARQADLSSAPVLIDNTPPAVSLRLVKREGGAADLEGEAADQTSPLKRAEFSLDAGFWQPLEAEDGVTDSPREKFRVHLDKLRSGEHLVVIRVYDLAGNAGLAKVLLP